MSCANELTLAGTITATDALRFTPAGIALLDFRVEHASGQQEAGGLRQVGFEMTCLAVEEEARILAALPLGTRVRMSGFLAPRGRSGSRLVLHVRTFEIEQGD